MARFLAFFDTVFSFLLNAKLCLVEEGQRYRTARMAATRATGHKQGRNSER
jgi:hypothetical protein